MPKSAVDCRTPYYVLLDENRPFGPPVVQSESEAEYSPVFGFSDSDAYAAFRASSQIALTPDPLVKGYLRNQIGATDGGPHLVVIDAAGPNGACLHAATMEDVLEAREQRKTHVTSAFKLILDQEAKAYRMESESV